MTARVKPALTAEEALPIPAAQAKSQFLRLLDTVSVKRTSVVISRRGKPIARLVPIAEDPPQPLFGRMKGKIRITGDLVSPDPEAWESEGE